MNLPCPQQLDDLAAARFIQTCWRERKVPELVLDFAPLRFVYPAGTLIMALGIRDLVQFRQDQDQDLTTRAAGVDRPRGPVSYLKFFGFFQFVGIDVGNYPDDAPGGRQYIPITRITRADFDDPNEVLQEQITRHAYRLAGVVYRREQDISRVDMLAFCLREIIRNVFEHAEAEQCFVMAQRWKNGYAEIAIADEGEGIPKTLAQTHNVVSPRAALRMAMKPGISRVDEPDNNNRWQNSGFGLYVVSELGSEYGSFSLLSDHTMVVRQGQRETWHATPVPGTAVKLRASTDDAEYFPNILQNIVTRGEEEALAIPGARRVASKGSKLFGGFGW